ncbi:MAG: thioredoxin family protein [Candidatus Saccharicenans sp.]|nr:thioredoxin family protein [Candidatus Saccharicenans sp.]
MEIKVLGMGCPKCFELERRVKNALERLKMEATVEKVSDLKQIMSFGVFSTPALVIDGKVVSQGHLPSVEEILNWLQANREK